MPLEMKYPGARGLQGHSSKDWEYLKYKHVEYQIEQHSIKAAKREVAQLSTPHTPRCPSGVSGFSVLLVRIWSILIATGSEVSRSPRAAGAFQ